MTSLPYCYFLEAFSASVGASHAGGVTILCAVIGYLLHRLRIERLCRF